MPTVTQFQELGMNSHAFQNSTLLEQGVKFVWILTQFFKFLVPEEIYVGTQLIIAEAVAHAQLFDNYRV